MPFYIWDLKYMEDDSDRPRYNNKTAKELRAW